MEPCPVVDTDPIVAHIEESLPPPMETRPLSVLGSNRRRRKLPTLNGWVPDETIFVWGLPGNCPPLGDFDPLNFAKDLATVRRYREAEVMHGRVAMVAFLGYLVGEELGGPVVWHGEIRGPGNDHLFLIPGPLLAFLTLLVGIAETLRARRGFVEPDHLTDIAELKTAYYPGDLGWDPLGLKPTTADDYADMQTKELNHGSSLSFLSNAALVGRLAMLATSGICAQELVTHQTVKDTLTDLFNGLVK